MTDNRQSPRQRTLKGARIVLNDKFSTLECVVRNLSGTGARLKIASVIGVPEMFELRFDDGRSFQCQVAWRKPDEIGVTFLNV